MSDPKHAARTFPWTAAIFAMVLVIFGAFALVAYLRTLSNVGHVASRGADAALHLATNASTIAEKFRTGRITHTFRESIPEVTSTRGDILELATSRSEETFTRSDEKRAAWDWIYLGTTVAEIRVPVTFRYHLRLSDRWQLAARDHVCLVIAPPIRASLPPAIHTDAMEKHAESGWARFDKLHLLAELERGMTATLEKRAMDEAHLSLVREACRQSVAAFVRNWLMREDHWRKDRFTAIVVRFPDEVGDVTAEELALHSYEPTIELESLPVGTPQPRQPANP